MNNPMNNLIIVGSILIILYIFTQKIQNENISESNNIFSNDKDQIIKIFIKKSEEEIQLEKQDTIWHISNNDTLTIRQTRIDDLFSNVLEVKSTTIRSRKQSNWVNYSVDDSTGTHLLLIGKSQDTLGYYVFGRSKSDWAHNFVRIKKGNINKDELNNVFETNQSIIHNLNTSLTYWGEKLQEQALITKESDSLSVIKDKLE